MGDRRLGKLAAFETAEASLELAEARIEPLPARRQEVNEHIQIRNARLPLGLERFLYAFEASDLLSRQPAYLGQVPSDRQHLFVHGLLKAAAHQLRDRRLELGCNLRERRELGACALEDTVQYGRIGGAVAQKADAGLCALDRVPVHRGQL